MGGRWFAYIEVERPQWGTINIGHVSKSGWRLQEFLIVDKDGISTKYEESHNVMLF